ncbi:AAA domain-containing protein [Actinoplanes sp. NPDC049802]|uniref:AAA domain-containing protein n=1 Tax=Actinoplanes sp. NPDC049802 TaxID=3154742 RepID=UPI00340E078E
MGSTADAVRLVERFLCGPDAEFGPYRSGDEDEDEPVEAEELAPGRIYRLRLLDRTMRTVDIQLFLGIEELGGLLWEQDVRSLLRASGTSHPALPVVLDGGYLDDTMTQQAQVPGGMAFVATRGSERCAGSTEIDRYQAQRAEAVRQFRSLAEGLAELHFLGISHRSVSPASIDVHDGGQLRLARFELSSLILDLFRTTVDSTADPGELREVLGGDLTYAPPERVAFLLGAEANLVESPQSDVYGLAAVVWEWFLGPFPAEHRPAWPGGTVDRKTAGLGYRASRTFARYLRETVLNDTRVPPDLAGLLASMLADDADDRPSADEVLGRLSSAYDRIMTDIEGPVAARKHLMVFMPVESSETIHRWGFVKQNPETDSGREELAAYIAAEMRGAYMTYSPFGAEPFVRGTRASTITATQVIRGTDLAWFCDYYRPRDEHGAMETHTEQALIIRYVARLDLAVNEKKLRELDWTSARLVPDLELRAIDVDRAYMARRIARSPSWKVLVEATRPVDTASPDELGFREAIDWLLDFQEVELKARTYPFEVAEPADGSTVLVHYDAQRDQHRIVGSALFVKYAATPALRPEFGVFFGALENEDGDSEVDVLEDRNGRPGRWVSRAHVESKEGQDRVRLRRRPGEQPLPKRGWIRPADDRGSQQSLDRQRAASLELYRARHLQEYLRRPRTIRTFAHHWKEAGAGLKGGGREVVQEILVCEPFSAVQGPPGTGKTRVAAAAIAAYLQRDPTARILVSAQSNFALDNLAMRVLRELGEMDDTGRPIQHVTEDRMRPLALRVSTRGLAAQERVDRAVRPWRRLDAAVRLTAEVRARVDRLTEKPESDMPGPLVAVLGEWSRMLSGEKTEEWVVPELADRLHRGANLVFATCAASAPELLSPTTQSVFNWVVVEEAAKAWPTEVVMPLLRGQRWTLIGDHFQLPAHRRQDLKRFLDACAADTNAPMAAITPDKVIDYMRRFDLFGTLFEGPADPKLPLTRMSTQFRMREPIGELVSRVFYPAAEQPPVAPADGLPIGDLATYIDEDVTKRTPPIRLKRPRLLDQQSLVWLDTAGIASCHDEPYWSNSGEAALVRRFLEDLDPFPVANKGGYGPDPLAVLTPYREQMRLLQGVGQARPYLSTVHAFQGREADMVIVSLVRDRARRGRTGVVAPGGGLGHLAQRQLVNVLFSRARRQLVLIGRFDHYARNTGFWPDVCRAVELYGVRLSAEELYGNLPGLVAGPVDDDSTGELS